MHEIHQARDDAAAHMYRRLLPWLLARVNTALGCSDAPAGTSSGVTTTDAGGRGTGDAAGPVLWDRQDVTRRMVHVLDPLHLDGVPGFDARHPYAPSPADADLRQQAKHVHTLAELHRWYMAECFTRLESGVPGATRGGHTGAAIGGGGSGGGGGAAGGRGGSPSASGASGDSLAFLEQPSVRARVASVGMGVCMR